MHWAARLYRRAFRRVRRSASPRKPRHQLCFEGLETRLVPAVTVGDTVFRDTNNDGILNNGETGVAGVSVELTDQAGTTVLGTTTTDSNGVYTFAALNAGTYRVRLAATNFVGTGALVNFTASTNSVADPENNVNNDSNGVTNGTLGSGGFIISGPIILADGTEPTDDGDTDANTNLTLDFGVVPPAPGGPLSLGDLVFRDENNNGTRDTGENGVGGVVVELLDQAGTTVLTSATTNSNGVYSFTGLVAGTYRVRLAASNFTGTGALVGFTAGTTSAANPDNDVNDDNNGALSGTLGSNGFIVSGPITLAAGTEPTNDGDTDASTNLTLDFGVVPPATGPVLSLGNLVWSDANNNGTFDTGESGINGVTVQLLDAQGTVLQTTTTAGGGLYTFTALNPGDYRVRLAEANFQTGGVLVNFKSSTSTAADPDDNVDNNDDGADNGTLGQAGGFIQSALITLAAGTEPTNDGDTDNNTNLTLDFGVVSSATGTLTLGDRVFRDANNNGQLDSGEVGLNGVAVQLVDAQGLVIKSTTTSSTGVYSFASLAAGDYRVRLAASNFNIGGALFGFTSSTFTSTDPDDNLNNNDDGAPSGTLGSGGFIESGLITLTAGGEPTNDGDTNTNTNLTLDFGVVPPNLTLTLGNSVWNDANNNGLLDSGETGIAGVSVQLLNPAGSVLQSAVTDASGHYTFTGLAAGDYRVRLAASNFTGSGVLVGFTSSTGTNGSLTGAFEGAATPDPDSNTDNDDNGQVSGTLGSTGFIETGLITLSQNSEPTSDGDTDPNTNLTLDLGVFRKFSVGNLVFNDLNNNGTRDTGESGLPNVQVRLLNADSSFALVGTATTNAQGQYLFTNLLAGNYAVDIAASNFNAGGVLASFKSSTGLNNAFEPAPSSATDNQDHGSTTGPLGSGGSVQSQTIAVGPGMPTGESPNNDASTPDNQSNLTIDFGMFQQVPAGAGISGRVFMDHNNSGTFGSPDFGIQGVTITLSGSTLTTPLTIQTDAQGNFTFTNLQPGTYTITETQPTSPANQTGKDKAGTAGGNTTVANTISNIVLAADQQATGYQFAEVPVVTVSGAVFEDQNGNGQKDAGEPGISGVIVELTGTSVVNGTISPRSALTDTNGSYSFANVTPGTYAIKETQPSGFVDGKEQNGNPAATAVTNDRFGGITLTGVSSTATGYNFGEVKGASIAGFVYDDVNDDGAMAATGETGIAGVTIRLTGTNDLSQPINRTTTTGSDGSYSFTGLRPGTYSLIETQPGLYRDGKETAGTSAGNATAVNNQITNIALGSGAAATGYLFGEHATADAVVSMTPTSATVAPGGTVTITYTVRNRGTGVANGVEVTLTYGGLTFVSASSPDFDETTKKWTVGDLGPDATDTITVTFRAPASGGTFGPAARVSTTSTELSTTNNTATSTIFAGTAPPPITPILSTGSLWFLSSSTNARKI